MKSKSHIWIRTIFVKSVINKTIGHFNKTIGHVNKSIQSVELEKNNEMATCVDKYKQTLSAYDIEGEENTSGTYENK